MPSNTALASLMLVKVGLQAISSIYGSAPSLNFISPDGLLTHEANHNKLERNLVSGDNRNTAPINGRKTGTISLALRLTGLNRSSDTAATAAATNNTEVTPFLTALLGVDPTNQTGSTVAAGTDVDKVVVASAAGFTVGCGILVTCTVDGVATLVARTITAINTNELVLDVDLPSVPATGSNVIAGATFKTDAAGIEHKHLYLDVQHDLTRYTYAGCLGSANIDFKEDGNYATLSTSLNATVWDNPSNHANDFVAPTVGNEIISLDAACIITDTEYTLIKASLDLGNNVTVQPAVSAANGVDGYRVISKKPVISLTVYYNKALEQALQASGSTHEVALQFGRQRGAAVLLRMPAAYATVKPTRVNEQECLEITFTAGRSTEATDFALTLF